MLETLLGSFLGGVFRTVPEVMKLLDAKNEREHELAMLGKEMEFAKIKGEISMREAQATMTVAEIGAMSEALKEQGQTARAAGKFVSAISALVRPLVTYWFVVLYSAVKIASMAMAIDGGANWKEVLISSWSQDDMSMLGLLLTFWFTGRVWERNKQQTQPPRYAKSSRALVARPISAQLATLLSGTAQSISQTVLK